MSQQDASSGYFQVHEPPLVGCHTMAPLCLTMKWGNRTIQITQLQRPCTESNGDPELSAVLYRWNNSYQDGAEIFLNEFQWLLLLDILAEDWYLALEAVYLWCWSLLPNSLLLKIEHRRKKKISVLVIFILLLKDLLKYLLLLCHLLISYSANLWFHLVIAALITVLGFLLCL